MEMTQPFQGITLQLLDAQEYKLEGRSTLEFTNDHQPLFGFVQKGAIKITSHAEHQHRTATVTYGEVFLLPADCHGSIQNSDKWPSQLILLRFQYQEGTDSGPLSISHLFSAGQAPPRLAHFRMPRFRNWIQDLVCDNWRSDASAYFITQSFLYTLAAEFMAYHANPKPAHDLMDYVLQVKQDLRDQFNMAIDIEETARLSGSSPSRFYQEFKQHTGLSPLKYMTMAKLNESLRLLAGGTLSVMEAAHSVGYPDPLYFSRLFKKYMGISPSDYAARTRRRVANLCPVFRGDLSVLGITPILELSREWYNDPDKNKYIKQVALSQPELIFTAPVPDEIYAALSQICPVVMITWKGYSWKERLTEISGTLQIPTIAERWLAYFELKRDNARNHVRRRLGGVPFLVASVLESGQALRVYGLQRMKMSDLFYGELQMTPPPVAHSIEFLDVPELAQIAALDCDHLLLLVPSSYPDESCIRMEEEWLELKRKSRRKQCLFIRYEEPLLYNPSFYVDLIDQFVDNLIRFP